MTTVAVSPHVAAVQTLLAAPGALPAGVAVYDGDVPATPSQTYVVLYPDPGTVERSSLVAVSDRIAVIVQVTSVGSTPLQARGVLDAVRAALTDRTPTVSGRNCFPITEVPGAPPIAKDDQTRDPTINQPRFFFTPQFVIASTA